VGLGSGRFQETPTIEEMKYQSLSQKTHTGILLLEAAPHKPFGQMDAPAVSQTVPRFLEKTVVLRCRGFLVEGIPPLPDVWTGV
jgi:hypothetical protein